MTKTLTVEDVLAVVRRRLEQLPPGRPPVLVRDDGLTQDDDWYYAPISFPDGVALDLRIYEGLVDLEEQMETEDGLKVVLVPTA